MNFVLDASVALGWCFEDERGDYAVAVLASLRTGEAAVSSIWPLEITNGLAVAERRGRIDAPGAAHCLDLIAALPLVVDPVTRARTFSPTYALARRHRLSTYDASYLELASRLGVPLATLDDRLLAAAREEGVATFEG